MWRSNRIPRKALIAAASLFLLIFFLLPIALQLLFEMWWFRSVHYERVFFIILRTRWLFFFLFWITGLLLIPTQILIAIRAIPNKLNLVDENIYEMARRKEDASFLLPLLFWVGVLFAFFIGVDASKRWETVLLFFNRQPFQMKDPLFGKDIGFYIFSLPFYHFISRTLLVTIVAAFGLSLLYYLQMKEVRLVQRGFLIFQPARTHIGILLTGVFILVGITLGLQRYDFLFKFSPSRNFPGAGFADVHFTIPALTFLMGLSFVGAAITLFTIFSRNYPIWIGFCVFFVITAFLSQVALPTLAQRLIVEPNELHREKPYITHAIRFTRFAFGLHAFTRKRFSLSNKQDPAQLKNFSTTLHNVRLWDAQPFLKTIRQLQEIWPYYIFQDVDFDHYLINGKPTQVVLAVRELQHSRIPRTALHSWINRHFTYTHGIGAVIASVSRSSKEGLPDFTLKDIPPKGSLIPAKPQVYFGELGKELLGNYVFVGGKEKELDYPSGQKNIYTHYQGQGGIPLSSFWRKIVAAFLLQDFKIVISSVLTPQSRILVVRNIKERARRIAPYLLFDSDPYPVMGRDRIYWILDAYTTTSIFPYSQPQNFGGNIIRYLRNSVKVVIDAYDGSVSFYVVDKHDPVLNAYAKAFPKIFLPLKEMPEEIRQHIRYPYDLFSLQADLYRLFHTEDTQIFFSRQDVWSFPTEVVAGDKELMQPYYVMLQKKASEKPVFSLMLPFTPTGKENMTAWMAAHLNPKDKLPEVLVYRFPKNELTYGPMQIESRIDNDPEISKLFTLWSQKGSQVIRGNLLVIPLGHQLLYVEPVYLQAEESSIPELKRVIVATEKKVSLGETLEEALALSGEAPSSQQGNQQGKRQTRKKGKEAKVSLTDLLRKADQALQEGNLELFGRMWNQIREAIHQKKTPQQREPIREKQHKKINGSTR